MSDDDIAGTVAGYLLESERYLEALMQEAPLGVGPTQTTLFLTRRLVDTLGLT